MSSITRQIVRELLGWLAVVLALLTLVLLLVVVAGEASRMNLGLRPTLRLLPFVLPTALAYAAPCAMLFAVCLVYGRMSADNEIVALKALGVRPLVVCWPAWWLAAGLSLVGVWLTDLAFSWGQRGVQRVVVQSIEEIVYGMLRTQRSYANARFSIIVKEVQDRRLIRPTMNFQASGELPAIRIAAAEAELRSDLSRNVMTLILTDCEIEMAPSVRSVVPGRTVQEYPLTFFAAKEVREGNPTHLPLRQIGNEIPLQRQRIVALQKSLAAETALALLGGELDQLGEAAWAPRHKQLADAWGRLFRLQTEPWRRSANGFSTLCFVLVGLPLAILLRKSDFVTTFGYVFLPILVAYYPLLIGCVDRAKAGAMPPYVVWLPNLLLALAGVWLMRRVVRY
jgi:lipopolysaccharide export system permease protein